MWLCLQIKLEVSGGEFLVNYPCEPSGQGDKLLKPGEQLLPRVGDSGKKNVWVRPFHLG